MRFTVARGSNSEKPTPRRLAKVSAASRALIAAAEIHRRELDRVIKVLEGRSPPSDRAAVAFQVNVEYDTCALPDDLGFAPWGSVRVGGGDAKRPLRDPYECAGECVGLKVRLLPRRRVTWRGQSGPFLDVAKELRTRATGITDAKTRFLDPSTPTAHRAEYETRLRSAPSELIVRTEASLAVDVVLQAFHSAFDVLPTIKQFGTELSQRGREFWGPFIDGQTEHVMAYVKFRLRGIGNRFDRNQVAAAVASWNQGDGSLRKGGERKIRKWDLLRDVLQHVGVSVKSGRAIAQHDLRHRKNNTRLAIKAGWLIAAGMQIFEALDGEGADLGVPFFTAAASLLLRKPFGK